MIMKILFLNHNDSHGGAAIAAMRLLQALKPFEINTQILVKNKITNYPYVIKASEYSEKGLSSVIIKSIEKISKQYYKYELSKYTLNDNLFISDVSSINLKNALKKIDFDILHLHWVSHNFLNLHHLKDINKPIVWTLHDCWPFTGICHYFYTCDNFKNQCGNCMFLNSDSENDLSHKIWRKKYAVYKQLDLHVVTPSRWLGEQAKLSSLLKKFPVVSIPNPIDTVQFKPSSTLQSRIKLGLEPDKHYLLFGAINAFSDQNKGYHLLGKALNKLKKIHAENLELIIFGGKEKKKSIEFGWPATQIGFVRDESLMLDLYNAADLTIVPSKSENLSCVIMESMACGTPVAAFNVGGNSDMIKHKDNGYLATPFSSDDLANGIKWCLESNNKNKLSKNARIDVVENFDNDIVAKQYVNLYESIF